MIQKLNSGSCFCYFYGFWGLQDDGGDRKTAIAEIENAPLTGEAVFDDEGAASVSRDAGTRVLPEDSERTNMNRPLSVW